MTDLDIVKEIEKELGVELEEVDVIEWNTRGYTLNSEYNLTALSLFDNSIKDLNVLCYYLKQLLQLETLYLINNEFSDLTTIKELTNLVELDLRGNNIANLEPIKHLTKLKVLQLDYNKFTDINPLSGLKFLKELFLSNNSISNLTPLINLKNLVILDIKKNKIDNLNALSKLSKLLFLNASFNQIVDLKPLKNLTKLSKLDLSYNKIRDITPLQKLSRLQTLILEKNEIMQLPKWLFETDMDIKFFSANILDSIKSIYLRENPITIPPKEIMFQGRGAVVRYFERIEKEGHGTIFEAKLTLVGDGGVGKTSLMVRLLNEKAPLPKMDQRTRGIEVLDWVFEEKDGIKHLAHVWDFGGQDVYFPVHRFFLTENSVFVLLDSTRTASHNFDYWIPTISQFGGRSPVIIGQTCHDGNKVPWNDLGYYIGHENFNIIKTSSKPYYELNLKNKNEGLENIKNSIKNQLMQLPHIGKNIPKSWVGVREELAHLGKETACISYFEFQKICFKKGEGFKTDIDVSDAAIFFHSIGVLLWFNTISGLKEWIIIQAEWAVTAVYRIIDDKKIIDNEGHIEKEDFERIWANESYENKFGILKKMLEVFKIAFPKKHSDGDYIIPSRLNSMPSDNRWPEDQPYLRVIYKYQFMPRGLVNQLSADLSKYITNGNEVWNNAVNLSYNPSCQIEENYYTHEITIKASGNDARALIVIAMNALDDINSGYKGVIAEKIVPCSCKKCEGNPRPTLFKYDDLIRWVVEKEDADVFCNEGREFLKIDKLLFNVGLENPAKKENNKKEKTTIQIFLASSSELKDDRVEFELFIGRENKKLNKDNIFLELTIWEDFIDAMTQDGLQKEYNKAVRESDIFVSLFFTKVGKFTEEEFEEAFGQFTKTGKPLVYTYFKTGQKVDFDQINLEELKRKKEFEEKLKTLKHYITTYNSPDNLLLHFKNQLEKVLPGLK